MRLRLLMCSDHFPSQTCRHNLFSYEHFLCIGLGQSQYCIHLLVVAYVRNQYVLQRDKVLQLAHLALL